MKIEVLVGPGQSPATYAVTPRQITGLENAAVYFTIGVPFEQRLLAKITASLPQLNVTDSCPGVEYRMMDTPHSHEEAAHNHEPDGESRISAANPDPHVWLDPKRVKIIAENICAELCRIDPVGREEYRGKLARFQQELDALDAKLSAALAPLKGREFFVFHPAYGYFGQSYGLKQVAVEIEGKEPSPRQVIDLIDKAKAAGVRVIFVQPQFASGSAEAIAREIGGVVIPLDPLGRDYVTSMSEMADKLVEALGAAQP